MQVIKTDKYIKLVAEEGYKITDKKRTIFSEKLYLPPTADITNYDEVDRSVWRHFLEEDPDIIELQKQISELQTSNDELGELLLETDYRLLQIQIYGLEEI